MKKKNETSDVLLDSGNVLFVTQGILGIDIFGEAKCLYAGYDEHLYSCEGGRDFTAEDKKEIASHMAQRWAAWGGLDKVDLALMFSEVLRRKLIVKGEER